MKFSGKKYFHLSERSFNIIIEQLNMKIIVFAGGVGTRLWPLSRKNSPKQFGKVVGEKSTLQQAVERLVPEFHEKDIYVATGKQYKEIVESQLPDLPKENFFYEPSLQDVGPAIGLTSILLDKKFKNEPVAILWSDHLVKNVTAFRQSLRLAEKQIANKKSEFVFITQQPRFANQNCGWVEIGKKLGEVNDASLFEFKRLHYRPKLEEAEEYFKSKNHVWNLGYFVTTPGYLVSMYKKYAPEMYEKLTEIRHTYETPAFEKTVESVYPTIEKISFDDAILMKLDPTDFSVIASDLGWSDVGTWDALKEALTNSSDENITMGDVMLENTKDTLLFNYSKKLCLGIDLDEIIVINTEDVLLVCKKESVPKIKKFVEKLQGTAYEHLV